MYLAQKSDALVQYLPLHLLQFVIGSVLMRRDSETFWDSVKEAHSKTHQASPVLVSNRTYCTGRDLDGVAVFTVNCGNNLKIETKR